MTTGRKKSECPYCFVKLDTKPRRKKKCPHCLNFIYVRNGQLVTEQAVPDLKGKGDTGGDESSNQTDISTSSDQEQGYTSGTLDEDLAYYANELYTKHDYEAGWELVKELVGAVVVGGFFVTALTIWLPGIGITFGTGMIVYIMSKVAEAYNGLNAEGRKQVRAVISWIKDRAG